MQAAEIRIERDPAFWRAIADHPEVRAELTDTAFAGLEELLAIEAVAPLASRNGGYIFIPSDTIGRVVEAHRLYRPEGRGKEAFHAGCFAVEALMNARVDLMLAFERAEFANSKPPRTMGWRSCGFERGGVKTWILTRDQWMGSEARAKMARAR